MIKTVSLESAGGVKVISRAARILRVVAASPTGLTSLQLARDLGLPRSTVYRIVGALENEGLLRTVDDRRLLPGPVFSAAGAAAGRASKGGEGRDVLSQRVAELSDQVEELRALLPAAGASRRGRASRAARPGQPVTAAGPVATRTDEGIPG
jgi:DNA-binding IclR family transcriptional regulator